MATILTMPKYGETMEEGVITEWMVKIGDSVEEGDIIATIETEKSVFEFEAPISGKIIELLAELDQEVPVNEPIAVIG